MPVALQPPLTCNNALNVVTFPSISDRGGVGKRDGTAKAFQLNLGSRVTGLFEFRARQDDTAGNGGTPNDWADLPPGLGAAGTWLQVYPDINTLNVAGSFTTAGGSSSERFAQYDVAGEGWTDPANSFSTGVDNPSRGILWDAGDGTGTCLYACGGAGTTPTINKVARWKGAALGWEDLSIGSASITSINAICVFANKLFVAGAFTAANGTTVAAIAMWDPTTAVGTWVDVGGGITGGAAIVLALASYGGYLYAGGSFTTAGGVACAKLARWDGTIYSGGSWYKNDGVSAAAWSAVAGFAPTTGAPYVQCMTVADVGNGSKLYVGGCFRDIGAIAGHITGQDLSDHGLITSWDGTDWVPLQNGLRNATGISLGFGVTSMEVYNDGVANGLWVTGEFNQASTNDGVGVACPNVAKWDGVRWTAPEKGLAGGTAQVVRHMIGAGASPNTKLFATGSFTTKNNVAACAIAKWDGTEWTAFGGAGVHTPSGTFTSAVAEAPFLRNSSDSVVFLAVYQSNPSTDTMVFGCGPKVPSATVLCGRYGIASWDGDGYHELSGYSVAFASGWVTSMHVCDAQTGHHSLTTGEWVAGPVLYAGGLFSGGSAPGVSIAAWTGSAWIAMGTGLTGATHACYSISSDIDTDSSNYLQNQYVYVGGDFTGAGGVANTAYLARWNWPGGGSLAAGTWSACNNGGGALDGIVRAVFADNDTAASYIEGTLYIGGDFTTIDGVACTRLAKSAVPNTGSGFLWAWGPMGAGCNAAVNAICTFQKSVYVAGAFTTADGVACAKIARWTGTTFEPLAAGITGGNVRALFVHDDGGGEKLYVGGDFTAANGVTANGIARWDGVQWETVDRTGSTQAGFSAQLATRTVTGFGEWLGDLIAVGVFQNVSGVAATYIARGDVTA